VGEMRFTSNSRAFTLVEMLVSVILVFFIFSYLYYSIDNLKKTNAPYLKSAKKVERERKVFELIFKDLVHSVKGFKILHNKRYDIVVLQTENSLYDIAYPIVTYAVSKQDNTLIRIESLKEIDLKKDYDPSVAMYADIIAKKCESFKVSQDGEAFYVMVRAKNLTPIVISLRK